MSRILEFLAEIVRKIETLVLYFMERFSANFQLLPQSMKTMLVLLIIFSVLSFCYIVVIIFRLDFKRRLKDLRNVRYDYQLVIERNQGRRHSIIRDFLLFQKVVIIDEKTILRSPKLEPKKKKKKIKIKLPRLKDREKTQAVPLLDPTDDIYVLDFISLNRRMLTSTFFILITILTLLLSKYRDYDVIFRGIYMLRYENYQFVDYLGSWLFIGGFAFSVLMTIFIWIFFYTRGSWQDKLNLRWIYDTFDIVSIVPTFVAILSVLNAFVISPATVTHTSMEPNYFEGDRVFILHLAEYKQFDVVIVLANEGEYNPYTNGYELNEYYIKRIIGLPGDIVTITEGAIYVNGVLIDDSEYIKPNTNTYCDIGMDQDVDETCSFEVPEGEYFLLGDNRTSSLDSRQMGTFKLDDLYGKVIFKVG